MMNIFDDGEFDKDYKYNLENKGDMLCRHPYSKCRFMIGLAKKYRMPPKKRKCGVAYPDTVCKPNKTKDSVYLDDSVHPDCQMYTRWNLP